MAPDGPTGDLRLPAGFRRLIGPDLLLEPNHGLQILICGRDALAVRFERALSHDHLRELTRNRDVRLFERARVNAPEIGLIGEAVLGQTRVGRDGELVPAEA